MNIRYLIIAGLLLLAGLALVTLILPGNPEPDTDQVNPTATAVSLSPTISSPESSIVPTIVGEYQGKVTAISAQPVGYKNARLLTLNTNTGPVQFYVTGETVIHESGDDSRKTLSDVETGYTLRITGVPAEGGIEATEISIVKEN